MNDLEMHVNNIKIAIIALKIKAKLDIDISITLRISRYVALGYFK